MSWQKFHPDSLAWHKRENRQEKLITEKPSGLKQVMFSSGATFNSACTEYGVLLLVVSGTLQVVDQHKDIAVRGKCALKHLQ